MHSFRHFSAASLALAVALVLPFSLAQAKIVTLSMNVELDQVAPEDARMYRVGGHDLDRITYDDTKIDPITHRVRVSSLSHYIAGHWHDTEPADASTLDLSNQPYRLSFVASVNHGRLIVALFEADTFRMAMLARPDFHMLIAGKYTIDPTPLTEVQISAPPPGATIVALDIDITLDQLSSEETHFTIGQHHQARVFFDDTKIDPVSHRVAVLHEQHTPALIPKHLNPGQMPMSNAWLDFSGPQVRYHFAAAPTSAFPFQYFVLFDETTMRMTIRKQSDGTLLLAGPYKINPKRLTGPEIDAAVASSDPPVPPWVTTVDMPK